MKTLRGALIIGVASVSSQLHSQSTTTYTYDALGRLEAVRDGTGQKADYALDQAGNRTALAIRKQLSASWDGAALSHGIGSALGSAWQAVPSNGPGHIVYGPYTTAVPTGQRVATFRIMIDLVSPSDGTNIVVAEVFDATAGQFLGQIGIPRSAWLVNSSYQVFEVPFTLPAASAGHSLEMRVWTNGQRTVTVSKVGYY